MTQPAPTPGVPPTPPAADSAQPLRLHIGGEEVKPGWKILNIQNLPGVDFIGSALDLSQFADCSVDEIYASHVYEHLDYRSEVPRAFNEAFRVLKHGGKFMLGVPDLLTLCKMYLDPRLDLRGRWETQRMIMGGQMDPFDYHKVMFDAETLSTMLGESGFCNVRRVKDFGLFEDTTRLRHGIYAISLNVVAMKP